MTTCKLGVLPMATTTSSLSSSSLVPLQQIINKLRGHCNAVCCGVYAPYIWYLFKWESSLSQSNITVQLKHLRWPANVFFIYSRTLPGVFFKAIFDRTGQDVITGSDEWLVKIWSTETGLCLCSCHGHGDEVWFLLSLPFLIIFEVLNLMLVLGLAIVLDQQISASGHCSWGLQQRSSLERWSFF